MKTKKVLQISSLYGILLGLFIFVSCDEVQQDPLHDQPKEIRNATVRPMVPRKMNMIGRDSLFIDIEDSLLFVEGELGIVKVGSRVVFNASNNVDFSKEIHFEGLPAGAQYNEQTETLSWQPERDFIGAGLSEPGKFKVILLVSTPEGIVRSEKMISFFVHRKASKPKVISVKGLELPLVEEESLREFFVYVKSLDGNVKEAPVLDLYFSKNRYNATRGQIYLALNFIGVRFLKQEGLFEYHYKIPVIPEVQNGLKGNLVVKAISRYGISSDEKLFYVSFKDSPNKPLVAWPKDLNVEMHQGQNNAFSFLVQDLYKEGRVEVEFITNCSRWQGSGSCACDFNRSLVDSLSCTIDYKPAVYAMDRVVEVQFKVRNQISVNDVTPWVYVSRKIRTLAPSYSIFPKADSDEAPADVDVSDSAPADTPFDKPADASVNIPVDVPEDIPSNEAPADVDVSDSVPADTPSDKPANASVDMPVDVDVFNGTPTLTDHRAYEYFIEQGEY